MALSLAWLSIPFGNVGQPDRGSRVGRIIAVPCASDRELADQAVATAALCNILPMAGQSERAIELGEEGVGISEKRGELWARGYMLGATSQVHWRQGDRHLAEVQARAGAATKHVIDDRAGLQLLLETLAWMAAEGDAPQRAAGDSSVPPSMCAKPVGSRSRRHSGSSTSVPSPLLSKPLEQRSYNESYERRLHDVHR